MSSAVATKTAGLNVPDEIGDAPGFLADLGKVGLGVVGAEAAGSVALDPLVTQPLNAMHDGVGNMASGAIKGVGGLWLESAVKKTPARGIGIGVFASGAVEFVDGGIRAGRKLLNI